MKRSRLNTLCLLSCLALVLDGATAAANPDDVVLTIPAVFVYAQDPDISSAPAVEVADESTAEFGLVAAEAKKGGTRSEGRVGLREVLRSLAYGANASTVGYLWQAFTVEDPQHRPVVKTILDFKVYAAAGAPQEDGLDTPGDFRDAAGDAAMAIFPSYGSLVGLRHYDLQGIPMIAWQPEPLEEMLVVGTLAGRWVSHGLDNEYYRGSYCSGSIRLRGQILHEFSGEGCDSQAEAGHLELTHSPGSYVMIATTGARGNGLGVSDPVWLPHPDNPDVVITRLGPAGDPGPLLAGITPEDLLARGIDPAELIELGFFDAPPPPPPAPGDVVPPTTVASPTPGANANGWNNSAVTVNLVATDEAGGSGVKEIRFAMSGATTGSEEVVQGSSATVQVSSEGETTVTYFAVDNAGNAEEAQTLTVRIDMSPPLLGGLPSAGCALWPPDHRLVQVAMVTASDARSGLAAGAPTVTATSSEPEVGTEAGDHAPDVVISGGAVKVRAERAGAGPGRVYTITASARDRAGNLARVAATCTVPHDRGKNT